jgi:hypothetical protein
MDNNRQEDLDMLSLVGSIKKGIRTFFTSLIWLFDFSMKNFKILFVFMFVFAGLCFGLYLNSKPYYKSELTVNHIRFENDYCNMMVHNLNSYLDHRSNNKLLAEQLGIGVDYAKEVQYIAFKPVNQHISKRFEDSVHVILPFIIEVEVYNNDVLDTLQKGILNYLESNEYATKRKMIETTNLNKISERVENEIQEIDSLKKLVNQSVIPRGTGSGIIFGEPIDPVRIYYRGLELYEKKLSIEKVKKLNNSFEILIGFSKNAKRSSSGKLTYLGSGAMIGYFLGLIFLVGRRRSKKNNGDSEK